MQTYTRLWQIITDEHYDTDNLLHITQTSQHAHTGTVPLSLASLTYFHYRHSASYAHAQMSNQILHSNGTFQVLSAAPDNQLNNHQQHTRSTLNLKQQ